MADNVKYWNLEEAGVDGFLFCSIAYIRHLGLIRCVAIWIVGLGTRKKYNF